MKNEKIQMMNTEDNNALSLNDWFEIWYWDYKSIIVKRSTLQIYYSIYQNQVAPILGNYLLSQIKAYHIQKLYNHILEHNLSSKYLHDIHSLLHNIFDAAISNDIIIKNPCMGVIMPNISQKERRVLSVEEQQLLLNITQQAKWKQYEPIIKILLGTGMRIGELFALTWQDIDFQEHQITINKTLVYLPDTQTNKYKFSFQTPKTKNAIRSIPMQHNVENAFRKQIIIQQQQKQNSRWNPLVGFDDLIFLNKYGHPRQRGALQKTLNHLIASINRENQLTQKNSASSYMLPIHPHTLRHTFATRCFEAGIPPKTVQMILGHSNIQITLDLYTHVSNQKKRSDLQNLEKVFQDIY